MIPQIQCTVEYLLMLYNRKKVLQGRLWQDTKGREAREVPLSIQNKTTSVTF